MRNIRQMGRGLRQVRPFHAVIDIDSQNMLPRADDIIAYARR